MAAESTSFDLPTYLARVGLDDVSPSLEPTVATLASVMDAHLRSIPFENVDVVLKEVISMEANDVYEKLVQRKRGGYCFEHNMLLDSALQAIGFKCSPLLCRVRWGKAPEQQSPFTHYCLKVEVPGAGLWLADVGFAGTNSVAPVELGRDGVSQALTDGVFKTTKQGAYTVLSTQDRKDGEVWRDLYKWTTDVDCDLPDLVAANWFSCTFPGARFPSQFFASILSGDEKRHIL